MNRAARRASHRHYKYNKVRTPVQSIRPVRKSRNGFYLGISVLGCVLSMLWGYTSQSWLPYILAGFLLLYALNFGRRLYVARKKTVV